MIFTKNSVNEIKRLVSYLMAEEIYCNFCGSFIDGKESLYCLCDRCMEKMNWISDEVCAKCGKPLKKNYKKHLCEGCIDNERFFQKGYVTTGYGLIERSLISDFKKCGKTYLAKSIAAMMSDKIQKDDIKFDFVTSVPIHKKRMKSRGFNQSEILAQEISKITEMPYCDYLIRKCDTIHMKELDRWQRQKNIENAFKINEKSIKKMPLKSKDILLIDDILTTGATLNQCSKVLMENGAKQVVTLVFAG